MIRSFLLPSFALLLGAPGIAQPIQNFSLSSYIRSYVPMDLGSGNTAYVCDRNWGYDSSYVELLITAADQSVTEAASHRLQYPLTFMNHSAKLDDGLLVSGGNYSSFQTLPFLWKTDASGAVEWYSYFNNLSHGQDQVIRVVASGSAFSAYTYPGGTYADAVYRINGESTGATYTGADISAPALFRVFGALATSDPQLQLVSGAGAASADPSNMQALLMLTDANGGVWMKLYDMGGTSTEDLYGITPTADGNFLCAGYYTTATQFEGVLMKVDPNGAVLWCKKYADVSGGLFINAAYEMGDGNLLIAGFNSSYQGILAKLDPSGTPIWTRLYAGDQLLKFFESGTQLKVCGNWSQIALDANGEGCDLVTSAGASVSATAYSPIVTSLTVTNTPFTPTTMPAIYSPRVPVLTWTPGCIWNTIAEVTADDPIPAHPVPSSDFVYLGEEGEVLTAERVILRDVTGAIHFDGGYGDGIDLRSLAPGVYICEIARTQQRARIIKQ